MAESEAIRSRQGSTDEVGRPALSGEFRQMTLDAHEGAPPERERGRPCCSVLGEGNSAVPATPRRNNQPKRACADAQHRSYLVWRFPAPQFDLRINLLHTIV